MFYADFIDAASSIEGQLQTAEDSELPWWSRTYCGYRERFVEPYSLNIDDMTIEVKQSAIASSGHAQEARSSSDGMSTGSTVWDAAIILSACFFRQEFRLPPLSDDCARTCLELGSGTGLLGIAAASSKRFTHVYLSDLASVVPLISENLKRNVGNYAKTTRAETLTLRWDSSEDLVDATRKGPFDLIIGSDLLYRLQTVDPLLVALQALVGESTTVLLAASMGHSPECLRDFCEKASVDFIVSFLSCYAQHPDFSSPEVCLLHLVCRKPASLEKNLLEPTDAT